MITVSSLLKFIIKMTLFNYFVAGGSKAVEIN